MLLFKSSCLGAASSVYVFVIMTCVYVYYVCEIIVIVCMYVLVKFYRLFT